MINRVKRLLKKRKCRKSIRYIVKHNLDAKWHWYRFEYQARGSIHCHGVAKLKNDPGLCNLSEKALKGYLAEKSLKNADTADLPELKQQILDGKKASDVVCTLMKAWIDIGKSEKTPGISYVAISRLRTLPSCVIEPMTFERLTSLKKSVGLQYRLQEESRLDKLAAVLDEN